MYDNILPVSLQGWPYVAPDVMLRRGLDISAAQTGTAQN